MSFLEEAKEKSEKILKYWNAICKKQGIERIPALMYGSPLTLRRQMRTLQSVLGYFYPCWEKTIVEELIRDAIDLANENIS